MIRSEDRILTTHTGSLPRPHDLIQMMFASMEGIPVDTVALAARVRSSVKEVVDLQRQSGIDIVNDGEMSKPSYATYIKDRLSGFGGDSVPVPYQDLVEYPSMAARVFGDPGRSRRKTPGCNAPIEVIDRQAALTDVRNLTDAVDGVGATDVFMSCRVARRHQPVLPRPLLRRLRAVPVRHR